MSEETETTRFVSNPDVVRMRSPSRWIELVVVTTVATACSAAVALTITRTGETRFAPTCRCECPALVERDSGSDADRHAVP